MCSESGLPDDLSWGRLRYIRWLDTAQDLCHSKTTHPLDHTDFTVERHAGFRLPVGAPRRKSHTPNACCRLSAGHI